MRAIATSCVNSPTVFHVRTAPPAVELDEPSLGVGPVPISACSTAPSDADKMQCAHGYSGCIGVSMKGVQPESRASPSALRMAVIGLQKLKAYFASKTAISASSMAIAAKAKKRALSVTSRPGAFATERATGQYTAGAVASQNFAMAVCSCVRLEPFIAPSALTSSKSLLHTSLFKSGGGLGRNWSPLFITHGRRLPQCGTAGFAVGT